MLIKICGIQSEEAAQAAVDAGADYIGFVFAPSKRQITPERAAEITAGLSSSIRKVGVFVNETKENIEQTAKTAGLDVIQLHGDEPPEFAADLDYPVLKAYPMTSDFPSKAPVYPCDYLLVDSPRGPNRGGNGTTFDWKLLSDSGLDPEKIILAGGLTPDNVQAAITAVNPAGVDVSSGVETNGQKDAAKISRFVRGAKTNS
ncbi:phosphoribosylanthranilate isomerase [Virgibacillus siamensis]|uniref:phosphoribosylanthranilate isomerase n=1 Tax=Virgibacillus siamensis TaxID=480071 RepID=UPI0015883E78|nr:phosphoribosylanthranilate isomerase [Virgibacillus siamensis]